ncbi:MAG TPA: hypothetical protein PKD86_02155 [Gemmatales bacterium]|nr:hypothetical protein [Gemmatales bacterium]HMP58132.1 hypothetical protein [Gemmatales bacterium]
MRSLLSRVLAAAAVLWAFDAFVSVAQAQVPPSHCINRHPPYWTRACCTCRAPYMAYGLYGMHDAFPGFPPGPVMPPGIPARYLGTPPGYGNGAGAGQGQMWIRSPRDFFMMPGY